MACCVLRPINRLLSDSLLITHHEQVCLMHNFHNTGEGSQSLPCRPHPAGRWESVGRSSRAHWHPSGRCAEGPGSAGTSCPAQCRRGTAGSTSAAHTQAPLTLLLGSTWEHSQQSQAAAEQSQQNRRFAPKAQPQGHSRHSRQHPKHQALCSCLLDLISDPEPGQ